MALAFLCHERTRQPLEIRHSEVVFGGVCRQGISCRSLQFEEGKRAGRRLCAKCGSCRSVEDKYNCGGHLTLMSIFYYVGPTRHLCNLSADPAGPSLPDSCDAVIYQRISCFRRCPRSRRSTLPRPCSPVARLSHQKRPQVANRHGATRMPPGCR